ncbi:hypothetical protein TNCV_1627411 [Trichonephila clavipes]|nr:hypothetical protein TNCV_1627411 [Trichonephila clavipes]
MALSGSLPQINLGVQELHQLKYEAISVPQGSVRLVKKTQERKSSTCYLLITKDVTSSSPVPLKTRCVWERQIKKCTFNLDSVAIEVSSRPKLTGIVRGKAFLHVLRRRPIGCPDSRKRTR